MKGNTIIMLVNEKIKEELYENAKIKGDKEISPFADPSSIK